MTKALVLIAPGFEEIEASTIVDILRRCNIEVTMAGLKPDVVEGSHGIVFGVDKSIDEVSVKDYDAVICPCGVPGYKNLRKDQRVLNIIKAASNSNKLLAAIGASPAVLSDAGVLEGKECTIYPGMEEELKKGGGKTKIDLVVVDGNIVTSRGPATALPFALKLAEKLAGEEIVKKVSKKILADLALKK
ncbi:MAG: DJ-1/PfpI family protein [Candidatus Methylarchaceae archaeon HK01B]|nr:DJ-1/PfpI family protein [Candidatus Methylarchaceae archaeon HK02M1]MCP8319121.1 DJ-1/PfpI family protein [Candidatus Methylarchaceae archaeon HK01B]